MADQVEVLDLAFFQNQPNLREYGQYPVTAPIGFLAKGLKISTTLTSIR